MQVHASENNTCEYMQMGRFPKISYSSLFGKA